ncbi:hypothetical protein FNV43_RR23477 [Rhamnella rubrinervis]|uniref:KIB1-4 beta-propeller domain-containing protein n=1 Tax=Rhamnella rubrinervis TaxID=2594499 RepID=A0A8K0DSD2_9ROSA|nr:hypothetical protein FNV43_RR23477 [Rhamnella rubrinervis]
MCSRIFSTSIEGEKELEIRSSSNTRRVKRQPPLLFMLGELSGETKHAIVDPIKKTYNIIYFPELKCQSQCLASRFGWLLILSRETSSLFFFNPITRSRIVIPYWNHVFTLATFSAPPDSQNCTIFAIEMPKPNATGNNIIRIDTLTAGQEAWTPHLYLTDKTTFTDISQAVYNKGRLYCLDLQGRVGIFDAKYKSWNVVPSKGFDDDKVHVPYMVEFNGEIYAGKMEAYAGIEKLERLIMEEDEHGRTVSAVWMRTENMGNFSIHLGPYGSCVVPLQEQGTKKKVLVADQGPESKCLIYENVSIDGVDDCIYQESSIYSVKSLGGCYAPVWVQRPNYVSSPEIIELQPTDHGHRYTYSF